MHPIKELQNNMTDWRHTGNQYTNVFAELSIEIRKQLPRNRAPQAFSWHQTDKAASEKPSFLFIGGQPQKFGMHHLIEYWRCQENRTLKSLHRIEQLGGIRQYNVEIVPNGAIDQESLLKVRKRQK